MKLSDYPTPQVDAFISKQHAKYYAHVFNTAHDELAARTRRLEQENGLLVEALENLLLAADNSTCDSTICMQAREALAAVKEK